MPKVIVYHSGYGCDTGCCGHVVQLRSDAGESDEKYLFDHPDLLRFDNEATQWVTEDPRVFAERLVRKEFGEEHVADLAWDECVIEDY